MIQYVEKTEYEKTMDEKQNSKNIGNDSIRQNNRITSKAKKQWIKSKTRKTSETIQYAEKNRITSKAKKQWIKSKTRKTSETIQCAEKTE